MIPSGCKRLWGYLGVFFRRRMSLAASAGFRNSGISRDSVSLRPFSHWKVPGGTAFLHHLLDFVMDGPASEVALASPIFFLPGRCRRMWLFSVTFSFSLCVNPRQSRLLVALRRFLVGKVPTDVAFLRHLLGFVMC